MNLQESIRKILREETIKKFDKSNANRGKFSDVLEKMVIDYIGKKNICDVEAVDSKGYYMIMVLYNGSSKWDLDRELDKFIRNLVPLLKFQVMIIDTKC